MTTPGHGGTAAATVHPLRFMPRRAPSWLEALGHGLRRHRRAVAGVQWAVVALYALLVGVPAFMPMPPEQAHVWSNLRLGAQFIFWGVWWPFVILSVIGLGRMWCGLLCPEGMLTEWASRHGRGRAIPRWMRWPGWPFVGFVGTTVWGQLVSVYDHPRATLLILGGSTVAAMAVGWIYGKGKRVWCRYLCPVSGVFALLARLAPLHYRSDPAAWKAFQGPQAAVDCAPLLDLRHLQSASDCHACGRCSGHRGAITLQARLPGSELWSAGTPLPVLSARLLLYGMLGLALGGFQWSDSQGLVVLKQAATEWLAARDVWWPLASDAPWWLLTHEPAAHDVFTWLDGAAILAHMAAAALLIGGLSELALRAAARLLRRPAAYWQALAPALLPLAAASLFVGLSQFTVSLLRPEGIAFPALGWVRAGCLALGAGGAMVLLARHGVEGPAPGWRRSMAGALALVPITLVAAAWALHFGALHVPWRAVAAWLGR